MAAMQAFPSATAWDQAELFDATVSAASTKTVHRSTATARPRSPSTLHDVAVVDATVDQPGVCFQIEIPGATANGCAGHGLLATGLAYGAFQDGDGPIEIVGIVPDEVIAIEVDGQTLTPTNNVWHYTATSGDPLTITVRSADGRQPRRFDPDQPRENRLQHGGVDDGVRFSMPDDARVTDRSPNAGSFADFYEHQYAAATVRLAAFLSGSRNPAEDLAQEAFLRLEPRFADIENPPGSP